MRFSPGQISQYGSQLNFSIALNQVNSGGSIEAGRANKIFSIALKRTSLFYFYFCSIYVIIIMATS